MSRTLASRADPGEIGRAILNLALNARDAMPEGGTLTIGTANVTMTEADARNAELAPGRYVTMAVHDTGLGIDADVRAQSSNRSSQRKTQAKDGPGSRHSSGNCRAKRRRHPLRVATGQGTTFTFRCPYSSSRCIRSRPAGGLTGAPRGTETILLVEDEDLVRGLGRQDSGKQRISGSGRQERREGLALCKDHKGPIDLLVSDVVMPELGGRELVSGPQTAARHESIFMSGHTRGCRPQGGRSEGRRVFAKALHPRRTHAKSARDVDSAAIDPQAIVSRGLWTGKFRIPGAVFASRLRLTSANPSWFKDPASQGGEPVPDQIVLWTIAPVHTRAVKERLSHGKPGDKDDLNYAGSLLALVMAEPCPRQSCGIP